MHYSLLDESDREVDVERSKAEKEDLEMNKQLMDEDSNGSCACVKKWSNQTVLMITCALFAVFVVAEITGALASNSLSLLGDGAAMSVDVFTYFTNMYAERIKNQGKTIDRPTRLMLEVYIPTMSVCALLGVTGWIVSDAVAVIQGKGDDDNVDIVFLYAFAASNFVVDGLSSLLFYIRGNDILVTERMSFSIEMATEVRKTKANLNMISALTHVGSDTMRTSSVFIAAVVASVSTVPSGQCDAWAAVVVSVTICCAVIPLVIEIYKAATK